MLNDYGTSHKTFSILSPKMYQSKWPFSYEKYFPCSFCIVQRTLLDLLQYQLGTFSQMDELLFWAAPCSLISKVSFLAMKFSPLLCNIIFLLSNQTTGFLVFFNSIYQKTNIFGEKCNVHFPSKYNLIQQASPLLFSN